MGKKARGSKLNLNPSSSSAHFLTDKQRAAVVRAYSTGGRLMRDLLLKFTGTMEDGRIDLPDIRHGKFVAGVVLEWAQQILCEVGLPRISVALGISLSTGPA